MTASSSGALKHADWLSSKIWDQYGNTEDRPFLVEIASNDGTFLERFQQVGFNILGVDPSNFADEATNRGLRSIRDFFGLDVANKITNEMGNADLIVARNVLGHSSELQDLVAGIKHLLHPTGTLILELPYAYTIHQELQYDYIFHEHLSYLTVGSLNNLFSRYDLKIIDVDFVHMNGGSLLCEITHSDDPRPRGDKTQLAFENYIGLNTPEGWANFSRDVMRQREALRNCLESLTRDGYKVAGYGAAAKFMTMLNYCDIKSDWLIACGDMNELKQGMWCPGVQIPVVSPADLVAMNPDYILIGAWNFKDEIIASLRDDFGYRGKFITPAPLPEFID